MLLVTMIPLLKFSFPTSPKWRIQKGGNQFFKFGVGKKKGGEPKIFQNLRGGEPKPNTLWYILKLHYFFVMAVV